MKRKIISLLLAVVMVLSLFPTVAFADGETPPDGAVAYVTDKDEQPIDAGEAGADGENDLGGGYYKTLQAAFTAAGATPATVQVQKSFSVEAQGAEMHLREL